MLTVGKGPVGAEAWLSAGDRGPRGGSGGRGGIGGRAGTGGRATPGHGWCGRPGKASGCSCARSASQSAPRSRSAPARSRSARSRSRSARSRARSCSRSARSRSRSAALCPFPHRPGLLPLVGWSVRQVGGAFPASAMIFNAPVPARAARSGSWAGRIVAGPAAGQPAARWRWRSVRDDVDQLGGPGSITLAMPRPPSARSTPGVASASDRNSSSEIPGGTSSRSLTLPATCTTHVTDSRTSSAGSAVGQATMATDCGCPRISQHSSAV